MGEQKLFDPEAVERYDHLSREELIGYLKIEKIINREFQRLIREQTGLKEELTEKLLLADDQRIWLRSQLFGKNSEKEPRQESAPETPSDSPPKPKAPKVQRLTERYKDAPRIEREVELKDAPNCGCCGQELSDSGMTENSEFMTVVPKQYFVVVQKRHKYRCQKCHGEIVTAPSPPRITPGGSYSDAMIVDVAMSKYCDLIPINRYVRMAERSGIAGLPPQSLIEGTHDLADFLRPTYELLRQEVQAEKVLHADETPHRMLEGDEKSHWYLWGFSSKRTSYFEAHDTRSGDVASEFLKTSNCEFLMSDVYSGYGKAVREANLARLTLELPQILGIYCNSHARRRFKESAEKFPDDSQPFIDDYGKIYHLESLLVDKPPEESLRVRKEMVPYFEAMKQRAILLTPQYPEKSSMGKALSYFLRNFKELTTFIADPRLPIDNNSQERLLRNPVIGRKTWYGTHSRRGAETMAILFSIVESCKLNRINPREFVARLVAAIHEGNPPYTPASVATH
jgi:transposase